jgi:hypothetical protein
MPSLGFENQQSAGWNMMQTDEVGTTTGGVGVWIFRVLLVAAAAFMVYSWFSPWWGATVAVLKGQDHLLLRPWGVEVVAQVRANIDESLFSGLFAGFMWTYLVVCMLALAASLFVDRQIAIGRFKVPLALVLIALVGLSYMVAAGLAYGIGELKAGWAGSNFIGKSMVKEPQSGAKIKMVSDLKIGYWLALGAGGALTSNGARADLLPLDPFAGLQAS